MKREKPAAKAQLSIRIPEDVAARFKTTENKTQVIVEALTDWFDRRDKK
jgi:hypothetical protein